MKKGSETGWPEGFELTPLLRTFAEERGLNADEEFEAWRDSVAQKGYRYIDWRAAWRTRIRNVVKWSKPAGAPVNATGRIGPDGGMARRPIPSAEEVRAMCEPEPSIEERRANVQKLRALLNGIGKSL
jgi:hypothetical protein